MSIGLTIELAHGTEPKTRTKEQLLSLIEKKVLDNLPYYQWIYKTVRTDADQLETIMRQHKLMP